MDMMRPVTVAVKTSLPETPTIDSTAVVSPGAVRLTWLDATPPDLESTWGNPANEIGFRVERAPVDASGTVGTFEEIGRSLANHPAFSDPGVSVGNTYAYRVIAFNESGETTSEPVTIGPVVDDTTPLTTSNVDDLWHPGPFSVSLEATDTLTGVAATYLAVDGAAPQAYVAPVDVSGEGTHTVEFWSEDASGNVEATNTVALLIDDTPPTTVDDASSAYVGEAVVHLSGADALSGVASTWWRLDGGAASKGGSVETEAKGAHLLEYWSVDAAGNVEPTRTASFTVLPAPTAYTALEGPRRVETALAVSRSSFPTGSVDTVVVASSYAWSDALVGSSLAGAYESPILLTSPFALSPGVAEEIARLGASHAVLLGGPGAVSPAAESALKAVLGDANVRRIGGVDRYETARLIAAETLSFYGCAWDGTAIVTTGGNFPDALSAAPLAAGKGWPIFLASPTGLRSADLHAMQAAGVDTAIIIGGTGAVPASVASALQGTLGAAVTRLGGADRYETSALVAGHAVSNGWLSWRRLGIATGENFPDGISGGAAQGRLGSVLLLTPSTSVRPATRDALIANKDAIEEVRFFGGAGALSPAVRTTIQGLLH
uniref:cell wall-binding repeat-containing protein n=1 Tax=Parvivirga hydrogeniphila TaxID=2939460 RepID=UPI003899AFA9